MAGKFSIEAIFKANTNRFGRPIAKMTSRLGKMHRRMQAGFRSTNKMAGKFLGGLNKIGLAATAAGVALTAGLSSVIKTGAEFEQSLVTAAAKFPDAAKKGTQAFLALESVAKSIGEKTEFSANEAAQGLKFLAMAGFTSQQAIAALPGLVDLATSAETDFAGAVDMASDALGAFGLETQNSAQLQKNLSRVSDVMNKTSNMANTSFTALFESFKEAGPVATAAGVSIEKLGAMAAGLANGGIKGAKAGTALKNTLLALSAPASAGAKALAGLGVATQVAGKLRDPLDILADMNAKLKTMGSSQRMGVLSKVFGREAIAGGARLLDLATGKLQGFETALINSGGTTAKIAKDVRDATKQDFKSLFSVLESVSIDAFDVIAKDVRSIVQATTSWVRANKDVIKGGLTKFLTFIKDNLPTIVLWMGRVGKFVGVLAGLAIGIKIVGAIAAGLAALASWPVLLAIGFAALVAFWPEIWGAIKEGYEGLIKTFSEGWAFAKADAMSVWTSVKDFFAGIWEGIKTIALGAMDVFLNFHPLGLVIKHWSPIKQFFSNLWGSVKNMFFDAMEGVLNKMRAVVSFFAGMIDTMKSAVGFDVDGPGDPGGDSDGAGGPGRGSAASSASLVTPAERVARSMSETRHSEQVEVTINDNSAGKATVARRSSGRKPPPGLQPSGAF